MAAETHTAYALGGTQTEQDRLLAQAKAYEPEANRLLDRIGVQPGWRALDIGCGPIGILNLLFGRVAATGSVVGLEREARFVEMAREEIANRKLQNVEIVHADALATGLERNSFDLVHERLVMLNVAARDRLLSEMVSLVRPGGTIVLEDIDNASWLCHPPHPSWDALRDAFHSVFHASGGNGFIGRELPGMLLAHGIRDVEIKIDVHTPGLGDYRRTHLLSLIDSLGEKVTALGTLEAPTLAEHKAALREHLDDPETLVIDKLFVQAWGRKPG